MYKYSVNTKFIYNPKHEKTILLNRQNGLWIKIPNVWLHLLNQFLNEKVAINIFLSYFEDNTNKDSFSSLFAKSKEYKFIVDFDDDEQERLEKVQFAITERCNLKCIHCCYDASFQCNDTDLSTNQIFMILDRIIACNPNYLTLSGGEPMLRHDFYPILEFVKKHYKGKISLSTNATLIREKDIPILVNSITSFDISLDGVDEITCEKIRGKGVFHKVLDNVFKLKAAGAENISLSMVDMFNSQEMREKFIELNEQLGTQPVIRALSPIGRASAIETKIEYLDKLYTPKEINPDELETVSSGFRGTNCGALRNQFFVNFNGDIYPCGILIKDEYNMGNILDLENFNSINTLSTKCRSPNQFNLLALEPDQMERCKDCEINFFCWGCLQEADMAKEDERILIRRCQLKKEHITTLIW